MSWQSLGNRYQCGANGCGILPLDFSWHGSSVCGWTCSTEVVNILDRACYNAGMDEKLLNLPWEIQLALGSGYVAYMLAYVGIREHHKPIDTIFRTIAFGLFATAILKVISSNFGLYRIIGAIAAAFTAGILWRFFISDLIQWCIRKSNLSWSDETPNAWSRITQHNRKIRYSQLKVQLDDDSWLFCENTRLFAEAPFGPCTLGPTGDIALYVTHKAAPGKDFVAVDMVRDPFHGDEITYVPANRVRTISARLWREAING